MCTKFLGDKGTVLLSLNCAYGWKCFLDDMERIAILQTLSKPTSSFIFIDEKRRKIVAILTKLDVNTSNMAPLIQTETGLDTKYTVILITLYVSKQTNKTRKYHKSQIILRYDVLA